MCICIAKVTGNRVARQQTNHLPLSPPAGVERASGALLSIRDLRRPAHGYVVQSNLRFSFSTHLHSILFLVNDMSSDRPNESEPLLPLHKTTTPTTSRLARRYITSPDSHTGSLPSPLSPGSSGTTAPRRKPFNGNMNGGVDGDGGGDDDGEEEEEAVEDVRQPRRKLDKGKGRAIDLDAFHPSSSGSKNPNPSSSNRHFQSQTEMNTNTNRKRQVTIIFSNTHHPNLSLSITPITSISQLKSLVRSSLPGELEGRNLRLIHSGRMLSDGVRIVPWVEAMEERVRRQAEGAVEGVVREVKGRGHGGGLEDGGEEEGDGDGEKEMIWIHCIVGGKEEGIKAEVPEVAVCHSCLLLIFLHPLYR